MYEIEIAASAVKALRRMQPKTRQRIFDRVKEIAIEPHSNHRNVKPLRGSHRWRLRVGDWRVIYEIKEDRVVLLVLKIGARGDVYDH